MVISEPEFLSSGNETSNNFKWLISATNIIYVPEALCFKQQLFKRRKHMTH